jgi:hypothetical protein
MSCDITWWGRWDSNPHWQEPKSCASAVGLRPQAPGGRRQQRCSDAEFLAKPSHMAGGFHRVLGLLNIAIRADYEG